MNAATLDARPLPSPLLGPRFARALAVAHELHWDHARKDGGTPYLGHLLGVAAIVLQHGGTEDEAIAALLHDAPEDRGGEATLARIEREFGATVSGMVYGLSDTLESPKPEWRKRKEAYVEHVRRDATPSVLLVGAADKLDNLRAILRDARAEGDAVWARFTGGRDGTLWYYRAVTEAYRAARVDGRYPERGAAILDEVERVLAQVEGAAEGRRVL